MSDCYGMHQEAITEAIGKGPRKFIVRGEERLAYGLYRAELKGIFMRGRYNVRTGSRWRTTITDWTDKDLFCDITTEIREVIEDKNDHSDWGVLFAGGISKDDMTYLKMRAEETGIKPWPPMEYWEYANQRAY